MKRCSKCGIEKEVSEFYKHRGCRDGVANECKVCVRVRSKKWKTENIERYKSLQKKYIKENRDKRSEYAKKYRIENGERKTENRKKWNNKNPDRLIQYQKNKREKLSGVYIRYVLKLTGFTKEQIESNPQLIELKKLIILNKRFKQQLNNLKNKAK